MVDDVAVAAVGEPSLLHELPASGFTARLAAMFVRMPTVATAASGAGRCGKRCAEADGEHQEVGQESSHRRSARRAEPLRTSALRAVVGAENLRRSNAHGQGGSGFP